MDGCTREYDIGEDDNDYNDEVSIGLIFFFFFNFK